MELTKPGYTRGIGLSVFCLLDLRYINLVSTNVEFTLLILIQFPFVHLVPDPIPLGCFDMPFGKPPLLELAAVLARTSCASVWGSWEVPDNLRFDQGVF